MLSTNYLPMMAGTYHLHWRGDSLQKKITKTKINLVSRARTRRYSQDGNRTSLLIAHARQKFLMLNHRTSLIRAIKTPSIRKGYLAVSVRVLVSAYGAERRFAIDFFFLLFLLSRWFRDS
jgi:hypothetical protein